MARECFVLVFGLLALCLVLEVESKGNKIPSYIQICKRNDPHVEDCIINSVEKLRPQLNKGIPELDAPALEPLKIPEIVVSLGNDAFKAVGHNVLVHGASNFKTTKLKVDIEKNTFSVGLFLPELFFVADYDADIRIGALPIKGRGPLRANATDITGEVVLIGKLVKKNGEDYLTFPSVEVELVIKGLKVKIDNLFRGDPVLNEAANAAINGNTKEVLHVILPIIERTVGNVILDFANKITKNFSYDELFPLE